MKAAYPLVPLGELCDVLDSKRRPITKRDRVEGEFPYYGATGILGYVEGYIFDEPLVLIGEDGAKWGVGENTAFSAEGRFWVNNHAHVIRPHRHKILDAWIIYQLNQADLSEFITGLTVPKLNQAKMREIPIIVPSLDEQQRIVAVLDNAFAGISTAAANAQTNLTNARLLFESYLDTIVTTQDETWDVGKLEDIGGSVSTGPFGSLLHKSDYVENGIPLVNPAHIIGERIEPDNRKSVSAKKLSTLSAYVLNKDDIVIGRRGDIGRCAVVTELENGWLCGTGCFFIRPKKSANPHFLAHLLRSNPYRKALEAAASGATMLNLSNTALSELEIVLPKMERQNQFLKKLDEMSKYVSKLAVVAADKLTALSELKQSLLQKAFAGELT
ncbi:restriction endonuclease subunit S [Sphingorhabdus sp.]|uniref:restriction endonuclease subunit S n=1 Tax=Sphingorhabdus sp. TaxID=1902408 RepID=UPI0039191CE8